MKKATLVLSLFIALLLPAAATPFDDQLKAAEEGDADAQTRIGVAYYLGDGVAEDPAEAARWWRLAADQGNATAQAGLGDLYSTGNGVSHDDAEAMIWFRKAAEQGHEYAQFSLGLACFFGTGVDRDFTEAVTWYRKAAEQGYGAAQVNLGLAYSRGDGVIQDYVEAVKWYRLGEDEEGRSSVKALPLQEVGQHLEVRLPEGLHLDAVLVVKAAGLGPDPRTGLFHNGR